MVQYKQTNLPWAIQPSNIFFFKPTQQEQYHVVCHMSGIVYIHYACHTLLKHHKRHSSHDSEYYCLLRLHNFNLTFFIS